MQVLASGRSATVFELGDGTVLRRYHDATRIAEREADVLRLMAHHRIRVPAVVSTSGPDLVMERISGPTMLAALTRRPWTLDRHAATLAALLDQTSATPAPAWLRRPFGAIGDAVVCHLDLHPGNIILSPDGPVVIDWEGAGAAAPGHDHALAHLIISISTPPGLAARLVAALGQRLLAQRVRAHASVPFTDDQLLAVAAARLQDHNVLPHEAARIRRLIERLGRGKR